MDNFKIDVTAEGESSLLKAIEIAFTHNAPGNKVESYHVTPLKHTSYDSIPEDLDGDLALVFRWIKVEKFVEDGPINLPFKLDAAGAADFAVRWLKEQDYGREYDHDGHNNRGWRMITGDWGHVGGDQYAICAIVPCWAMYGK